MFLSYVWQSQFSINLDINFKSRNTIFTRLLWWSLQKIIVCILSDWCYVWNTFKAIVHDENDWNSDLALIIAIIAKCK